MDKDYTKEYPQEDCLRGYTYIYTCIYIYIYIYICLYINGKFIGKMLNFSVKKRDYSLTS
jgi:hypothetical protein